MDPAIDTYKDLSLSLDLDFFINTAPRFKKYPHISILFDQYFTRGAEHNAVSMQISSVLAELSKQRYEESLISYFERGSISNQSSYLSKNQDSVCFYILDTEVASVPHASADIIIQKFFTNYYWYMESLIKQSKINPKELVQLSYSGEGENRVEHRKNWYEDFVEALHKYYPNEAKEIDERIKSGDLVEV